MTRTLIVLAGYLVLAFGLYFQAPMAPQPKPIVPVTAAQIKEGVRIEQNQKKIRQAVSIAAQVYRRNGCKPTYAESTGRVAVEFGLSARVLAGLVFVESSCNPSARSGSDSIGLTQVNPKVWGHRKDLRDPEKNLRIGASILAGYIHRFGLVKGLHAYNGFGNSTNEYAEKVLAAGGIKV